MRPRFHLALAVSIVAALGINAECAAEASPTPSGPELARSALSAVSSEAESAIAGLRASGPAGLQTLIATHRGLLDSHRPNDPRWLRLRHALSLVGAQHDNHASRLYWYTDLAEAQAAARAAGKPILSLRLLGRLDEELSCANSRFFRTALYADPVISQALRERFVLHWRSVRPVPRVTIDFGDGRTLVRTLTGNSLHYVLDPEGRPVDAIPGLYGPAAWLGEIARAEAVVGQTRGLAPDAALAVYAQYHSDRMRAIPQELAVTPGLPRPNDRGFAAPPDTASPTLPTATEAGRLAVTKAIVEMPLLRAMAPLAGTDSASWDDATLDRLAQDRLSEVKLAAPGRELVREHLAPTVALAGETALMRTVRAFERLMARDGVRNEARFHGRLHKLLRQRPAGQDLEAFNERVYAEVFRTPRSDPWLGLAPPDLYTGLTAGGVADLRSDQQAEGAQRQAHGS